MDPLDRVTPILAFWFGPDEGRGGVPPEIEARWFGGGETVDLLCREHFGEDIEHALAGERATWSETARSRLALILLLDQFTRNVFRGTPRAFAGDATALHLALDGIERGHDRELAAHPRSFFYMPFQHSEDLEIQRHGLNCFEQLSLEVPAELREQFETYRDYSQRHLDIVERFGRFPHRNATLGRRSTPEELRFLEEPGSSFG